VPRCAQELPALRALDAQTSAACLLATERAG